MMEDNARLQDELELYQNYGNFAVDNLFWCLTFMNSVLFQAPNANDIKEKLLAQKRAYEGLITAYYPGPEGQRLVNLVEKQPPVHHLHPALPPQGPWPPVESALAQVDGERHAVRAAPRPDQPPLEAAGMERDDFPRGPADYVHRPATCQGQYEAFVNTVPLCKNVAIDMAAYMASGIAKRFLA